MRSKFIFGIRFWKLPAIKEGIILIFFLTIISNLFYRIIYDNSKSYDEASIVKEIMWNDFYKIFCDCNIVSRDREFYIITSDSINEMDVTYNPQYGVILSKEDIQYIDKYKPLYKNIYMEKRIDFIESINRIIPYMETHRIKAIEGSHLILNLYTDKNNRISRFDNNYDRIHIINYFKNDYDSILILDSNWVIFSGCKSARTSN